MATETQDDQIVTPPLSTTVSVALRLTGVTWPNTDAIGHRLALSKIFHLRDLKEADDRTIRSIFRRNETAETAAYRAVKDLRGALRSFQVVGRPPPPQGAFGSIENEIKDLRAAFDHAKFPYRDSYLFRLYRHGVRKEDQLRLINTETILEAFPEAGTRDYDNGRLQQFIDGVFELRRLSSNNLPVETSTQAWHPQGREEGLWNIQLLARGVTLTLWQIGYILDEIYDESRIVAHRTATGQGDWHARTFENRKRKLQCDFINETMPLDSNLEQNPLATLRPTESIRAAKRARTAQEATIEPGSTASKYIREERHWFCVEGGIRAITLSRKLSWSQARCGMYCMAAHMDEFYPGEPHLPVPTDRLVVYSQHFANGGTLANYMNDLRMAHQMVTAVNPTVRLDWDQATIARLTRGAKKATIRNDKPIIRRHDLARLTSFADSEGDDLSATMYAFASQFTLRGQSEMFPLQRDGLVRDVGDGGPRLAGGGYRLLESTPSGWHSVCSQSYGHGRTQLAITLRRRKNKDCPTVITRWCVCHKREYGPSLCGVCRALPYIEKAKEPRDRVFSMSAREATKLLRRRCKWLNIHLGERMGWHAFRRGNASDLLADGEPISTILQAGGWKGPAALTYLARSELEKKVDLIKEVEASDTDGELEPAPPTSASALVAF